MHEHHTSLARVELVECQSIGVPAATLAIEGCVGPVAIDRQMPGVVLETEVGEMRAPKSKPAWSWMVEEERVVRVPEAMAVQRAVRRDAGDDDSVRAEPSELVVQVGNRIDAVDKIERDQVVVPADLVAESLQSLSGRQHPVPPGVIAGGMEQEVGRADAMRMLELPEVNCALEPVVDIVSQGDSHRVPCALARELTQGDELDRSLLQPIEEPVVSAVREPSLSNRACQATKRMATQDVGSRFGSPSILAAHPESVRASGC